MGLLAEGLGAFEFPVLVQDGLDIAAVIGRGRASRACWSLVCYGLRKSAVQILQGRARNVCWERSGIPMVGGHPDLAKDPAGSRAKEHIRSTPDPSGLKSLRMTQGGRFAHAMTITHPEICPGIFFGQQAGFVLPEDAVTMAGHHAVSPVAQWFGKNAQGSRRGTPQASQFVKYENHGVGASTEAFRPLQRRACSDHGDQGRVIAGFGRHRYFAARRSESGRGDRA